MLRFHQPVTGITVTETMKSSGGQSHQLNAIVMAGIIALVLAGTLVVLIYGCMKYRASPPLKQTRGSSVLRSPIDQSLIFEQEYRVGTTGPINY